MCHKVESSFVLIHQLKKRASCTISELVGIKNKIEKEFPSIFVDVSKKSLQNSVLCYPEVFGWENNKIVKKKDSTPFFEAPLINYFDYDLDKTVKNKLAKFLENAKD